MIQQTLVIDLRPTPEFLDILRAVVRSELANYTPPVAVGSDLPEYPTRRQTKEFLNSSYTTLNTLGKDTDKGPAVLVPLRMGGRIRYRREDVLALFHEKRRFKSTGKAVEGRTK